MRVFLIDGTYELFRHFFGQPEHTTAEGHEVGALRGVLGSVIGILESGVQHIGVATDHVIESFRNEMWPGYKTGDGIDPLLRAQFTPLEEALAAMGVAVWPMIDHEADDALATAAARLSADPEVRQVVICTPDKDLGQCVRGGRVVQLDRRKDLVIDEAGVVERFGVEPASIPDYLALVGDSADGFPGLPGWGAKSAAAVLSVYRHLEEIPEIGARWTCTVRGAEKLAGTLREQRELAFLFRDLATLRTDSPIDASLDAVAWRGPSAEFAKTADELEAPRLLARVERLSRQSG